MSIIESEPKLCTACWWVGMVSWLQLGISSNQVVCKLCWGSGKIIVTRVIDTFTPSTPLHNPIWWNGILDCPTID